MFTQNLRQVLKTNERFHETNRFHLDQCNPDLFNSEIVMECMKRTSDLHTTQQCLMLLSKGAQLFPVKIFNQDSSDCNSSFFS